jgi:hypothetical protein
VTGVERMAAAGRVLVRSVIVDDDPHGGDDAGAVLAAVAEDLRELFAGDGDDALVGGVVTLLRLMDAAVSHAALLSGVTRTEVAETIVDQAMARQRIRSAEEPQ